MKLVTYSDRSFALDDATADALIEFAALLISSGEADSVEVNAYSREDEPTTAKMLLGAGTPIVAEVIASDLADPHNSAALDHMASVTKRLVTPTATLVPAEETGPILDDYGI